MLLRRQRPGQRARTKGNGTNDASAAYVSLAADAFLFFRGDHGPTHRSVSRCYFGGNDAA